MAKVLVIDDDAAMRRMISRVLTEAHHQVIEAADGRDGIRKFRAEALGDHRHRHHRHA